MASVLADSGSTPSAGGAEDQRAAPRTTLLIRPAKLIAGDGEFLCVIRDVSATGVSVRLFHAPPEAAEAVLETEAGQQVPMTQVWSRNREAGFRFDAPIDLAAFINESGRYRKRRLRLAIELPVMLESQGQRHAATIRNLSQQGARVETDARLATAQMVRLRSEYLPEIRAQVRWRRDSSHGLVFEDTFTLADFATTAALLQSPALLAR